MQNENINYYFQILPSPTLTHFESRESGKCYKKHRKKMSVKLLLSLTEKIFTSESPII